MDVTLIEVVFFIIALTPVGIAILSEAVDLWKKGDIFNEFTLMLMASVGAFIIGEYPEGVAILLFYSFGEKLEDSASDSARHRISSLLNRMPKNVTIEDANGEKIETTPDQVKTGDKLWVKPGERIALDGVLVSDATADFDTSAITGESVPSTIMHGSQVSSGYIPIDKEIAIKVTADYTDSTMSRILSMVEEAASRKSDSETLLRRITRWYTPAVMLCAALLFLIPCIVGWMSSNFSFEWETWLKRSLVLLVCSCPCALVVSVPLSYFIALGNASKLGILFKGSKYLDSLRKVNAILLDKTGTVTTGKFQVSKISAAPGTNTDEILSVASAIEIHSAHPLAIAIVARAKSLGVKVPEAGDVTTIPHGLKGIINGTEILVGSQKLMMANGVSINGDESDYSEVYVAKNGKYIGKILLEDTVKDGITDTLSCLRRMGVTTIGILSGDREKTVANAAKFIGADFHRSELLPAEKHHIVEDLRSQGLKTAFIGDGINDAPSLAAADVGIAIGTGGTDVAMDSADAVITGTNLNKLVDAFRLSNKIKVVVTENVCFAIGVKLIVMILGALGVASLWAAVFADTGITLITILWTLFCMRMDNKER
ncbi:MAG: cadmium-translocating P-type ATPase [Muribaculum sp.]|nr:cadmium-translocating P-type ATPase [Muribaculum sp.]